MMPTSRMLRVVQATREGWIAEGFVARVVKTIATSRLVVMVKYQRNAQSVAGSDPWRS